MLAGADLERDEIVGKRMYGLSPVKLDKCGHAERILTDRDEPRRASQLDAKLASQPCIRLDRLLPALTNYALLRYSYVARHGQSSNRRELKSIDEEHRSCHSDICA